MPETWDSYTPRYRPATKADIFATFQTWSCVDTFFEDPDHPFGPSMSLYHWAEANEAECDIHEYFEELRNWFIRTHQVALDQKQWHELVQTPKTISLFDLCEYIVAHGGWMLNPTPLRVAGRECQEAGVFLTLRAAIKHSSNTGSKIMPSTSIDEVARSDPEYFATLLHLTCPHLAGQMNSECSWVLRLLGYALKCVLPKAMVCSILSLTGVAYATASWHAWLTPSLILMGAIVGLSWLPPSRIHIKDLETMGDLSREIAWHLRNNDELEPAPIPTLSHHV